jgi:hypothetical protein
MVGLDLKFRVSLVSIKEFRGYYHGENEQGHRRRNPHRRVFRLPMGMGLIFHGVVEAIQTDGKAGGGPTA